MANSVPKYRHRSSFPQAIVERGPDLAINLQERSRLPEEPTVIRDASRKPWGTQMHLKDILGEVLTVTGGTGSFNPLL